MYELTITIKYKSLLKGDTVKRRLLCLLDKMAPCSEPQVNVEAKEVTE